MSQPLPGSRSVTLFHPVLGRYGTGTYLPVRYRYRTVPTVLADSESTVADQSLLARYVDA